MPILRLHLSSSAVSVVQSIMATIHAQTVAMTLVEKRGRVSILVLRYLKEGNRNKKEDNKSPLFINDN